MNNRNCPECERETNVQSSVCPNCGYPFKETIKTQASEKSAKLFRGALSYLTTAWDFSRFMMKRSKLTPYQVLYETARYVLIILIIILILGMIFSGNRSSSIVGY